MIIALVVNSNFKGRGAMRAVMLVPWAIPTVVAAQMWKWMLDDVFGVINDAGVQAPHPLRTRVAWISSRQHRARVRLRCRHLEDDAVRGALLLLAGLQVIPGDLYEAARRRRREQVAAVLADHASAAAAGDPRRR